MEQGWVKLYRKIEKNDFLMTNNTAYILFTKLLIFADKTNGTYRTGQRSLAKAVNLPYGTTYSALKRLVEEELITIENHVKYSKIWITNWTVYQSNREIDDILEHNALKVKRTSVKLLPKTSKFQAVNQAPINRDKNDSSEAPTQAQLKRNSSAGQDYNKNEEIEIDNTYVNSKPNSPTTMADLLRYLIQTLGYSDQTRITKGRLGKLKSRLTTYKPRELIEAAAALAQNAYMQGDNDSGKRYGTIDYLLRNDEIVDNYLNTYHTLGKSP